MPLKLLAASYADMNELVKVIYAANSDPHDAFVDLCLPGLAEDSPIRRVRGERQTALDYLVDWESSSTQHWVKVVDTDTGKIVSASNWEIFEHTPYPDPPRLEAVWHPKGSRIREYTDFLVNARMDQGAAFRNCPHMSFDLCVTLPEYRRRGAASLMLLWGINKADELGLKIVVEATVQGQELYKRFGFVARKITPVTKNGMEHDTEWMELQKKYPLVCCWMERPQTKSIRC